STGLYFASQMTRLRDAGIEVAWIRGNHDAASQITRYLPLPDNVHELPVDRARTKLFEARGLAVHGRGFATRAVTENLAQSYPERISGLLNVGLLHTSVTGRPGHEPYAPCTLDGLRTKGYDYWALGHVHAREVLCEDPWVVFPGNLQGRHAKETGEKGATLVEYSAGGIESVTHRVLDVVRYVQVVVDLGTASGFESALEAVRERLAALADGAQRRMQAVRVVLSGTTRAHAALRAKADDFAQNVRFAAVDVGGEDLWIEKVVWRTQPTFDAATLRDVPGALGELTAAIEALRGDEAALLALAEAPLASFAQKLPAEARERDDGVRPEDARYLTAQLDEVRTLLLDRLLPSASGSEGV
ncbi:MAG TPA: DNA repair exonuclease, partial [Polyangiales bacterium]|nr:DNA repair exonuclease [Polyangiales bacterium]